MRKLADSQLDSFYGLGINIGINIQLPISAPLLKYNQGGSYVINVMARKS